MIKNIGRNLFEYENGLNEAHFLFFKLFELFILINTIHLSWYWGLYTLKITDVVLPLGLALYIDISFMHGNMLPLWNAGLISLLAIFAFARMGSKWFYAVAFLLFHLQYVARFSIGEIPHSANLIGMSVLCFALGMIFFDKPEGRYKFIIGSIIFFTGLGYTSAAFSKLIGTGINWVDGRHLWLWIGEKGTDILSREGAFAPNLLQTMALTSIPIATMILIFGLLTEFFGFLLWFKKLRVYIVSVLIGMHIGITMSMNIRFDAFIMELILIGYPWPLLIEKSITKNNSKFASIKKYI